MFASGFESRHSMSTKRSGNRLNISFFQFYAEAIVRSCQDVRMETVILFAAFVC